MRRKMDMECGIGIFSLFLCIEKYPFIGICSAAGGGTGFERMARDYTDEEVYCCRGDIPSSSGEGMQCEGEGHRVSHHCFLLHTMKISINLTILFTFSLTTSGYS